MGRVQPQSLAGLLLGTGKRMTSQTVPSNSPTRRYEVIFLLVSKVVLLELHHGHN